MLAYQKTLVTFPGTYKYICTVSAKRPFSIKNGLNNSVKRFYPRCRNQIVRLNSDMTGIISFECTGNVFCTAKSCQLFSPTFGTRIVIASKTEIPFAIHNSWNCSHCTHAMTPIYTFALLQFSSLLDLCNNTIKSILVRFY